MAPARVCPLSARSSESVTARASPERALPSTKLVSPNSWPGLKVARVNEPYGVRRWMRTLPLSTR